MAIEFENPITAGTVLVRSDVRSQNYSTGTSGWVINSDGSAEFNDVTIRGGTVVGGTALYYSGTPALGNLVAAISGTAGTDSYGNTYGKGVTIADSGYLSIYNSTGTLTTLIGGPNATVEVTASNGSIVEMTPADSVLGGAGIDFTSGSGDTGSIHVGPGAIGANIMMESEKTISGTLYDAYVSVYPNAGATLAYSVGATLTSILVTNGSITNDTVTTIAPAAGVSSQHLVFNQGYSIYADNTGAGSANSRWWLDAPNGGQVVIGPRAGANTLDDVRIRTNATTASAANMFIDSASFQIKRSTSSLKYKQDVEDLTIDSGTVRKLRPVRFRDKKEVAADPGSARWYVGLIAEDVHDLGLTDFVTYLDGKPDGLMYDRLCVALISQLRDVETRLAALENRLKEA